MRKIIFTIAMFLFACGGGGSSSDGSFDTDYKFTNVGRAPFAIMSPSFECDDFIESIKELPTIHLAFLFNTFGNNSQCIDRIFQDKRLQTVVMHLINEPGHRNKRLGSYEFLSTVSSPAEFDRLLKKQDQNLKNRFINYIQPALNIVSKIPKQADCIISPGLESNISDEASRILVSWTRELFPSYCRMLWNPLREKQTISVNMVGADLVEAHGRNPLVSAPCLINTDGTDISFPNDARPSNFGPGWFITAGSDLENYINNFTNKCEIVFLWTAEDNCIRSGAFVDPRQRRCSIAKETRINHLLSKEILRIIK
jgi:hypothetical protein